jgi:hypothetical protein
MSVLLFSTRYLKIESDLGIAGTLESPRSVSIWIKRAGTAALGTGLGREERIATFGQSVSSSTTQMSATIEADDDVKAESFVVAEDKSTNNTKITDTDTWHHVVGLFSIRDGSGGEPEFVQCYVDGVADTPDTSSRTGLLTPMAGFWIGADSGTWLGTSSNLTLNAKVAYCAVFDCILSAAEIASLGEKTPDTIVYDTNSAANLRAYWPLVADLNDASGNNYHLTSYAAENAAAAVYDPDDDNPTLDGTPVDPPSSSTIAPLAAYYQMMRGNL